MLLSGGFRLYLHYFNSYSKTYGSIGAVSILLLWLYLTALVVLIGGVVNAVADKIAADKQGSQPETENAKDTSPSPS